MKKLSLFTGLAAVLLLLGAGCSKYTGPATGDTTGTTPEETGDKAAQEEKIKIGVMVPLTGDAASYGESVKKGIELAKKQFKADNVELVYEDSKCDGTQSVSSINKLISVDKVVAIIGELCSDATLPAAPIAEQNKVVMISPASTAPTLTTAGDYIFRTIPSDASQGAYGAKLVADKGFKKLAVLYVNNDYGVGFNDVLKQEFPKLGGVVVASEAVDKAAVDVKTQLTKIKGAKPDALYIISNSPDTAIAALKQAKELGLQVALFGSEGLKNDDIIKGAKGAADGLMVTSVSAGSKGFMQAHNSAYSENPGPFSAQAYDAFQALNNAILTGLKKGEKITGEAIKNNLNGMSFQGVSGMIEFDKNGDVSGNYSVLIVKDNAFSAEETK